MKTISSVALAGVFALGLASAAQAQSPQIPSLSQTNPPNPVATDGSPLPHNNTVNGAQLQTGRSVFVDPVSGIVGAGVGTAGALVGAGVGVAGGAVDTGLNATGTVVNGTLDAAGNVVR
jgi:hypothetical protein